MEEMNKQTSAEKTGWETWEDLFGELEDVELDYDPFDENCR
jgi:hypothetical protein